MGLVEIVGAAASAIGGGGIVALIKGRWSNEAVLRKELKQLIEDANERIETLETRVLQAEKRASAAEARALKAEQDRDDIEARFAQRAAEIEALRSMLIEALRK